MGSRIKENPDRIFDGFFEVLRPASCDEDPVVRRQFPKHLDDQDSVAPLTKFCFPFYTERWENSSVQHFSFTLTDLQGYQRIGFCRLSLHAKSCICILSCLPWFELFYKLLNNIAELLVKEQINELDDLLRSLYQQPVPPMNTALNLEMLSCFITPDPARLPSIPENRNLTEFLVAVHVDPMLQLYSSLLFERRILITCSKLSTLTACVHASAGLLYPMYWQHIFIPTLPPHLLDYVGAPMPYLIGIHSSLMEHVSTKAMEDVVVFNVDTNNLETPFQDLQNLPPHVVSFLKLRLKKQSALMGDGMSRMFLRAQAMLFGSYRDALVCSPGEPISFCQESFVNHKCSATRSFLQNAVHLQLFTQFIDSRLEKLSAGAGFTDVFEKEITSCGLSGNSKSYQLWLDNLKKGSGSLIQNVKSRTHPAVKNMLRYAKGQARTGLHGMRSRIKQKEQHQLQRGVSLKEDRGSAKNHEKLQCRLPITQHFGQSRPRRPGKRNMEPDPEDSLRYPNGERSEESDAVPHAVEEFPLLEEQGMDLLEEIFETLNTRAPGESRALYGTHSLDFFNLEDSQYFARSISPTSEQDLSMSQPRDSALWYLQEEDEVSSDNPNLSPDVMSVTSENLPPNPETTDDLSPPPERTPSLPDPITSRDPEVTSPALEEDTIKEVKSETEEVTSQAKEVKSLENESPPSTEVSSLNVEVLPPTNENPPLSREVILPTKEVKPPIKEDSLPMNEATLLTKGIPSPNPESDAPHISLEMSKTTEDPSPTQQRASEKDSESGDSHAVSQSTGDPSVLAAVSRFQSRPLDSRLMWPGTKREAAQKVIDWINQQQRNTHPVTAQKSNSQTHRTFETIQTAHRTLSAHSGFTPMVNVPKPVNRAHNAPGTVHLKSEGVRQEVTPKPADLSSPSLPKVSELKKRFEG
ncbi:DENN domain-containing protein 1C [Spea bombifrons]|uniref:DENN domain-containing protein 1C n=1 Tax=Spea bombifrons TaxID=233779 RepID=UPI00234AB734|nr:DENN domain-containing protein 1C [Spea bombifrons]